MSAASHTKDDKTIDFHSKIDATKDESGRKHVDAKMYVKTEPNNAESRVHDDFKRLDLDGRERHHGKKREKHADLPRSEATTTEAHSCTPQRTPKDVKLVVEAHTDENGKKDVDFEFHFEGKRDHLNDNKDKDKDDDKDKEAKRDKVIEVVQAAAMAMTENAEQGPSGMVGAAVNAVGAQLTGHGRTDQEMAEFRERGGVIGVVKQKIGEKMYEKGEDLKHKGHGEVVRKVPDAIKYHYAHAEHYRREGLIQQELSKKEALNRNDRKAAKKKAREYFEMEKSELSRAHAEERLMAAPIKVEYLEEGHGHVHHVEKANEQRHAEASKTHAAH